MAWQQLVTASDELDSDLFRYDLVDITKEVLLYKFASEYVQLLIAFNHSDLYGVAYVFPLDPLFQIAHGSSFFFSTQAAIMVDILADVELVLASDRRFLLGNWIADAQQFGQTEEEIHFYNLNAKLQVSIWGNNYTLGLFDYASKFWSGMIRE